MMAKVAGQGGARAEKRRFTQKGGGDFLLGFRQEEYLAL